MHIPLGDEECLQVFGGLDVRWLYQFKERFQTRADVKAFIEQVIKSTGKTKLETTTKQVRPRGAFEGARCSLVDALFVEGSEVNRFERDNLLNQSVPSQEQPAHDSLDNPGGDFDSDSKFSRKERNKMLVVLLAMAMDKYGYDPKKQNSAARKISEAAQLQGISVTDDTIKKYLNEAFDKSLA